MKIVFDIGGTKTRVARLTEGGILSKPIIEKTPDDFTEGINLIQKLINEIAAGESIEYISGGIAGVVKEGLMINSPNLPAWNSNNITDALKSRFPETLLINVTNDTDVAGLGEAHYGAGRGYKVVAYFTISTGIGGSRIVNGKIDEYFYGFEPGWQIFSPESLKTFEEVTSGGSIYESRGKKVKDLSEEELVLVSRDLAIGIHNSIVHWSPEVVVLGGAVPIDVPEMVSMIEREVKALMKIFPETPIFKRTELEDSAGLWGALKL